MKSITNVVLSIGLVLSVVSCGGGGGGGGGGGAAGNRFEVVAGLVSDTCGERVSDVRQIFTIEGGGRIHTGIISLEVNNGEFGFDETSGDCQRQYRGNLSDIGPGGSVELSSKTTCGSFTCETHWQGTTQSVSQGRSEEGFGRISGENCNPNVPTTVGYRPSLFECNGNAAVLLGEGQRHAFSVALRRNGEFNDRDPNNTSCGSNRCSPYKTQKKIELPEYQVDCLGEDGFNPVLQLANRISIKYQALITNKNDTSQFEQYCLNDLTTSLN